MTYQLDISDKIVLLTIAGSLIGQHQLNDIVHAITPKIEEGHVHFILDLAKLKAINSTGLAILLTILTKSRNAGGDVVLTNIPTQLSKLLVITKLNAIFTVTETIEEAKKEFSIK